MRLRLNLLGTQGLTVAGLAALAVVLLLVMAGCTSPQPGPDSSPAPTSPGGVATTSPAPTAVPVTWEERARDTAQRFLQAWEQQNYNAMYDLLGEQAKRRIDREAFVTRYTNITSGASITRIVTHLGEVRLEPGPEAPTHGTVSFSFDVSTTEVGDFSEENTLPLVVENDRLSVDWTPEVIFRNLVGTNVVRLDVTKPARGSILDRKGRVLAGPGTVLSIGVVPGEIEDEAAALKALSEFLGISEDGIKGRLAGARPDWWVPLRDLPASRRQEAQEKLGSIKGIGIRDKEARVYPNGTLAAHVVGYVSPVTGDDLTRYPDRGYEDGDFIGRTGLEAWAEEQLAGEKGARLYIADVVGNVVRVIAERKGNDGASLQTTLDIDVQRAAEQIMGDKVGSMVVLDPRDNSVLAMVSHPTFDPNLFVTGISEEDWEKLVNDPNHPFQNRAALSKYPTGSIFKVITMAAGLERGGFSPTTEFDCDGTWEGLPGRVWGDWLPNGHGRLNLQQGLTESCDIVFYELGKKLDELNPNLLPEFARQFGLGAPTGTAGVAEAEGTVPDPQWKQAQLGEPWYAGDAVNLAIGQGYMEATPLQMANVYSTLAHGGELRTPVLVSMVIRGNEVLAEYKPEVKHQVPVSAGTLAAIHDGMVDVASTPRGTAYYAFRDSTVPTAAKTGSAENQNPEAHAWFAGYAPADAPEIVVLVMVEGGEEGGRVAAPLGRQIIDAYFSLAGE